MFCCFSFVVVFDVIRVPAVLVCSSYFCTCICGGLIDALFIVWLWMLMLQSEPVVLACGEVVADVAGVIAVVAVVVACGEKLFYRMQGNKA